MKLSAILLLATFLLSVHSSMKKKKEEKKKEKEEKQIIENIRMVKNCKIIQSELLLGQNCQLIVTPDLLLKNEPVFGYEADKKIIQELDSGQYLAMYLNESKEVKIFKIDKA